MGQQITPFLFEGEHMVRVVEMDSATWFVGSDVAAVLGHRDANAALRGLDEDEKGTHILRTPGGIQEVLIVSEAGVYQLVFTSRKPVAKRLKRWLAHDVIPTIRKTGSYAVAGEVISPEALEARAFPDWPLEEMRTKRSVVDMYRLTFGNQAAQWVCPKLGSPIPPLDLIEHGRQMSLTLVHSQEAAE